MENSKRKILISIFVLFCVFHSQLSVYPQVRPVYDYGAIGLGQLLKRLNNTKSVMHIGAHPDDEDSGLLAYLARGENARTAYLSLTRGDGGQNILGTELSESLGVIRTEELLQARRLDGAEQYFTRAYDFGFSKTLVEAKQKWDEKVILCDMVRAIRIFRPLVVISRFSGTPADGHGQHQFSGYISPLAVRAAADANQCADSGAPWQVLKFYFGQGFRSTEKPTLSVNTGQYDFLLGRSYFEIAMEGRSQHKTQEQGVLELKGERFSNLNLIESKVSKVENEKSVFDGIDVTAQGFLKTAGSPENYLKDEISDIQSLADNALRNFDAMDQRKVIQSLTQSLRAIEKANEKISGTDYETEPVWLESVKFLLENKKQEFAEAIKLASGLQINALSDRETITSGESFPVTARIFFPNSSNVKVREIKVRTPNNWQVSKADAPKETNQGFFRRETANETSYFNVKVPKNAELTQPFWLKNPRKGDLFDVRENANAPFEPPIVNCLVTVEIEGTEITFNQPVQYRFADDTRGEMRRNLNIVPRISLNLDRSLLIVPTAEKTQMRKIVLSVTNNSTEAASGEAKLNVPNGWKIEPNAVNFNLKNKGAKTSIEFALTIPANVKIGDFDVSAQAAANGEIFTQRTNVVAYPHIQTHRFYTQAKTKIVVMDLKTAPARVGYVMGSGDTVPEAIRQMGFSVELLNENDLINGDLSRFDTIVVGIRASEVRQDFVSNHERLLDFVKNGGTMIVQYQRPVYKNLLPFPAEMSARVTDENAKVTILEPQHPIFNFPNKITEKDFENWVQDRNLYSFTTFDAANYTPLLEAHDAGEPENKGGLMIAQIGKGRYVYTSYAFFRQMPAGVPGAYRIFANLVSQKN